MHLLFPDANVNRMALSNRLFKGAITALRCTFVAALAVGVVGAAHGQSGSTSGKQNKPKAGAKTKAPGPKRNPSANTTPMATARVVLVFPPDTKGGASETASDAITDVERGRLTASRAYRTVSFTRALPTVRMALIEQSLSQADVTHPYDVDAKLKKLAQLSGYDLALATTVNDYTYDEKTNSVSVVMSVRLIDFSGEKPVIRSAGASMSSPENPAGNPKQETVAESVMRSLTEKLMTDLLSPRPATRPSAEAGTR